MFRERFNRQKGVRGMKGADSYTKGILCKLGYLETLMRSINSKGENYDSTLVYEATYSKLYLEKITADKQFNSLDSNLQQLLCEYIDDITVWLDGVDYSNIQEHKYNKRADKLAKLRNIKGYWEWYFLDKRDMILPLLASVLLGIVILSGKLSAIGMMCGVLSMMLLGCIIDGVTKVLVINRKLGYMVAYGVIGIFIFSKKLGDTGLQVSTRLIVVMLFVLAFNVLYYHIMAAIDGNEYSKVECYDRVELNTGKISKLENTLAVLEHDMLNSNDGIINEVVRYKEILKQANEFKTGLMDKNSIAYWENLVQIELMYEGLVEV